MIGRLLDTTRVHSNTVLEGLLFGVFIALSILSRLRKILQTKVSSRKNVRTANCDVIDFDKTYSLDDAHRDAQRTARHYRYGVSQIRKGLTFQSV